MANYRLAVKTFLFTLIIICCLLLITGNKADAAELFLKAQPAGVNLVKVSVMLANAPLFAGVDFAVAFDPVVLQPGTVGQRYVVNQGFNKDVEKGDATSARAAITYCDVNHGINIVAPQEIASITFSISRKANTNLILYKYNLKDINLKEIAASVAGTTLVFEQIPLAINPVTPGDNAVVGAPVPEVCFQAAAVATGVDWAGVKVIMDSKPVNPNNLTISGDTYRLPGIGLENGLHTVSVNVVDSAGKNVSKSWSFTVTDKGNVSGQVCLEGQAGGAGVKVCLAGTLWETVTDASGNFSFAGVPGGNYTLVCSCPRYLTRKIPVNVLAAETSQTGVHNLLVGDVDGDNRVGLSDLVCLSKCYGKNSQETGFSEYADCNQNGAIGIEDLTMMLANFHRFGD